MASLASTQATHATSGASGCTCCCPPHWRTDTRRPAGGVVSSPMIVLHAAPVRPIGLTPRNSRLTVICPGFGGVEILESVGVVDVGVDVLGVGDGCQSAYRRDQIGRSVSCPVGCGPSGTTFI